MNVIGSGQVGFPPLVPNVSGNDADCTAFQWSEDVVPTVAFHFRKVRKGNVTLKIWDLAGELNDSVILQDSGLSV